MGAPTSFTFPLWGIFPGHDFGCFLWTQQRPSAYCYPVWLPTGNHFYTSEIHCHSYVHQETHLYSVILPCREITYPALHICTTRPSSSLVLHALCCYHSTLWTIPGPNHPHRRGWGSRQGQKHIPTVLFLASINSRFTISVSYFWWSSSSLERRQ